MTISLFKSNFRRTLKPVFSDKLEGLLESVYGILWHLSSLKNMALFTSMPRAMTIISGLDQPLGKQQAIIGPAVLFTEGRTYVLLK